MNACWLQGMSEITWHSSLDGTLTKCYKLYRWSLCNASRECGWFPSSIGFNGFHWIPRNTFSLVFFRPDFIGPVTPLETWSDTEHVMICMIKNHVFFIGMWKHFKILSWFKIWLNIGYIEFIQAIFYKFEFKFKHPWDMVFIVPTRSVYPFHYCPK